MKAYKTGQHVRHSQYGFGTILTSDEDRTSIDFVEHGAKLFVTSLVRLEPAAAKEVAPQPKKSRRPAAKSRKSRSAAKVAAR